jgi:hypothetical protein
LDAEHIFLAFAETPLDKVKSVAVEVVFKKHFVVGKICCRLYAGYHKPSRVEHRQTDVFMG